MARRCVSQSVSQVLFGVLLAICTVTGAATTPVLNPVSCPPLSLPAPIFAAWDDDMSYDVLKSSIANGMRLRVTGDKLRISSKTLASLIRDIDQAVPNLSELYLDARDVTIEGPLSFRSVKIVIFADSVTFASDGVISWTAPPPPGVDGLSLFSRTITYSKGLPRPLALRTATGSNARSVIVRAQELLANGTSLTGEAAASYIFTHSTDAGTRASGNAPNWDLDIGDTGYASAVSQLRGNAAWPQYFAYKALRYFARDPFSESNKQLLIAQLDAYAPIFDSLGASTAIRTTGSIKALYRDHVDLLGHGPSYVPREDMLSAIGALKAKTKAVFDVLPQYEALILASYDGKVVDDSLLKNIRDQQTADEQEVSSIKAGMTKSVTDLAANESAVVELNSQVAAEREELKKQLEDMKKTNEKMAQFKGAAAVVSVGAMLIPGAGPFVAAGVAGISEGVIQHNAGKPLSMETFAGVAQKSADFYAAAKSLQASWAEQSEDLDVAKKVWDGSPPPPAKPGDKPLTKIEASKRAAASAGKFAGDLKKITDLIQAGPAPTEVSANQMEADDGTLQTLLAAIADHRNQQAKLTDSIQQLRQSLTATQARIDIAKNAETSLLGADPRNDLDVLRWRNISLQLWQQQITALYEEVLILRRSVFFETGQVLDLGPDLYQFPEEVLTRQAILGDPATVLVPTRDESKAYLETEATKHRVALNAMARAAEDSFRAYEKARSGVARPYVQPFTFSNAKNDSAASRQFIEALNRQIAVQVLAASKHIGTSMAAIQIPLNLPTPPTDAPDRLVSIAVSDIQFGTVDALRGKTINLDTSYELAGMARRDGACHFVDMRERGAESTVFLRVNASNVKADAVATLLPPTFEQLQAFYAAPLARTNYYLAIHVDGDSGEPSWKAVPTVKSLTVAMRIVQ